MRRWATAFAALVLGVAAPLAAHAADKADYTKDQLDKGMKAAPAVAQKAGLPCTVTAAADIGTTDGKEGKGEGYEVACQQGLGYVLLESRSGVKAYDCLATQGKGALACKLPANANPTAGMASFVAAAKITCTPAKARYIGANPTTTVYEVACQEGPGYIIQAPAPGAAAAPTVAIPCLQTEGKGAMECTLTSKAQTQAAVAALVAKTGRQCQMSGERFIGTDSKTGDRYIEVGCGAQPGFVIAQTSAGGVDRIISCGEAQGLGGCTLTDAATVAASETADYTRMAKAGGFDCDVSKSRAIGIDADKNRVVELACSNRPDGTIAVFPSAPGGRAKFVDCIRGGEFGPSGACQLTSKAPTLARYSAALAAKGRSSCKVADARYLGQVANGDSEIETSCTDGKPGWVIEFNKADQVQSLLSCGQAKSVGMACALPTNVGH